MIYAEPLLKRTAAAVRIQQKWRKYLVVRNSKEPIYTKMKKTRAVLRIQYFWRNNNFYHRQCFNKNIYNDLKCWEGIAFYLPCSMYMQIQELFYCGFDNELYFGLTLFKNSYKQILVEWNTEKPIISSMMQKMFP